MTAPQLYWEDIQEGEFIPELVKQPTTQQLVEYAGASGDFYQIHYDKDFALSHGLPGIVVHGALKCAFLGQLLTDWIGSEGALKKLSVQYRGMDFPGHPLICRGRVVKKYQEDGKSLIDCELWIENANGEKNTPGSGTVVLPSRLQITPNP